MKITKVSRLMSALEKGSIFPIKGKKSLQELLWESISSGVPVSFYTWECMPRETVITPGKPIFYNFDVNIPEAIQKTKLVQLLQKEKSFFSLLNKYKVAYKFYIFTADTNPAIMYPESGLKFSPRKLENLSVNFQTQLQESANKIFGPGKVQVLRFSKLLKQFKSTYSETFNSVYWDLSKNLYQNPWTNSSLPTQVISHLSTHINVPLSQKGELEERARRYLASYSAEGLIISKLDSSGLFPNLVWVNNESIGPSSQATELARKKQDLPSIPTVYYFYKTI